jgi:hypothetical protein
MLFRSIYLSLKEPNTIHMEITPVRRAEDDERLRATNFTLFSLTCVVLL